MKPRPLLFTAEPEALGGNGPSNILPISAAAAPEAAPAAETPAAAPAAAAEAKPPLGGHSEAKPPSLLEKISASIQTKGALLASAEAYRLRAETAEAELATLRTDKGALATQLATLTTERDEIVNLLEAAHAEKQEVEFTAAATVASLGFDAAALPAAGESAPETRAALEAQLAAATDNATRFALAEKINALG